MIASPFLLVAVSLLGVGCLSPVSLLRQGRLSEAWRAACEKQSDAREQRSVYGPQYDGLDAAERAAILQAVVSQTQGTFVARALSRDALHHRLGGPVFATDIVLLMTRAELTSYPGSGVSVTPRFVVSGRSLGGLRSTTDYWKLAGIEQPTSGYGPSFKPFNKLGAVADLFIAGVTLGTIDPNLRGQKDVIDPGKPGTPGTGTDLQQQTLFQLGNADRATHNYERVHGGGVPGSLSVPYEGFYLVPAQQEHERVSLDRNALSLSPSPSPIEPSQDSLILHVRHHSDRNANAWCSLAYDLVVPLPSGDDLAARINALFAKGPIALGAP